MATAPRTSFDHPALQRNRQSPSLCLDERLFRGALVRERKRTDRSNQPLMLVLIAPPAETQTPSASLWRGVMKALSVVKRDTNIVGWFEEQETIGLLLPEVPGQNPA